MQALVIHLALEEYEFSPGDRENVGVSKITVDYWKKT
jgi:hypothetical protein